MMYVWKDENEELLDAYSWWGVHNLRGQAHMRLKEAAREVQLSTKFIHVFWTVRISDDGHPGTTTNDVIRYPFCVGDDQSLFEIDESRAPFCDDCCAHFVDVYGQLDYLRWNMRQSADEQRNRAYY